MSSWIYLEPPYILKPWEHADKIIFLAGPVMGTWDWQRKANFILNSKGNLNFAVANPRGPKYVPTGDPAIDDLTFGSQVDWEHHYLNLAAQSGVTLFWLAKETEHSCARAYAQTSRFELGEAVTRHIYQRAKVVVGIENGFSGAQYIKHTLANKAPAIPVVDSLEEVCQLAIRML